MTPTRALEQADRAGAARKRPADTPHGRKKIDRHADAGARAALCLIGAHYSGKKRRTLERVFLAIHELATDAFGTRGAQQFAAERRWLATEAGVRDIGAFDAAITALIELGLVVRVRRRISYAMNRPNLWGLAGVASFPTKPDTRTETPVSDSAPHVDYHPSSRSSLARERASRDEFRWHAGAHEHPALRGHGLSRSDRCKIARIYQLVRRHLLAAGVKRVPQGGWLAAIRRFYLDVAGDITLRTVEEALGDFVEWRREGGGLAYSFAWMHRYRRSPQPPPSLLFSTTAGEVNDRSWGNEPLSFWAHGSRW
jgi:hypothetical protein